MTKRRNDDAGFANVLKQKHKEDLVEKQKIAQNTFAMLMRAQRNLQSSSKMETEPSYQYFNNNHISTQVTQCPKCSMTADITEKCHFCENMACQNCLQPCHSCQQLYCSLCSVLDYSLSLTQVFCLSCKQDQ